MAVGYDYWRRDIDVEMKKGDAIQISESEI
jgi:hypothetical protein